MSWQQVCFDYDGSYPGFLTCVFESYAHREEAVCFTSPEEDRLTLWPERHVDTDQAKAERVYRSLRLPPRAALRMLSTGTVPPSKRTFLRKSPPFFIRRVRTALRRLAASIWIRTKPFRKALPVASAASIISR